MSYTWGSSATDGTLNAATITASSAANSAAINSTGFAVTECGLILTYNGGATKGAKVEIWRSNDGGTTYQASADGPFAFNLPFTAGGTEHYAFSVPGTVSTFKVNVVNLDSGQSITAVTLKIRQATN